MTGAAAVTAGLHKTMEDTPDKNVTVFVDGLNKAAETHAQALADGMKDAIATLGQAFKDSAHNHAMLLGGLICFGSIAGAVIPLLKACPK